MSGRVLEYTIQNQGQIARGGNGFPEVLLGPVMPYTCTPSGWQPLNGFTAVSGVAASDAEAVRFLALLLPP